MAKDKDFKPLIFDKLQDFSKSMKDYSLCEVLYSCFNYGFKGSDFSKKSLLLLSDEDFYRIICKAYNQETAPEEELPEDYFENNK